MKQKLSRIQLFIGILSIVVTLGTQAEIIHVPQEHPTIQSGISFATDGDTIIVSEGRYVENLIFNGKKLTLIGSDETDPEVVKNTVIDGNGIDSVITFSGIETEETRISGFTITNGKAINGAGIRGNGTLATIENCRIVGNSAENSSNGISASGGAIDNCDGLIQNNFISGNTVKTFATAKSIASGGGLANCDGTIQNNLVSENSAYAPYSIAFGGGLANCDGAIQNNLVSENFSRGFWRSKGGGIFACNGIVANNTVVKNSAELLSTIGSSSGGGFSNCNASTITNCIIWGNTADRNPQFDGGIIPSYSCINSDDGLWYDPNLGISIRNHNLNSDPFFTDFQNNDFRLTIDSPCIDAGNPNFEITTDLNGNSRSTTADIGAFEWNNIPIIISVGSETDKSSPTVTLTAEIDPNGSAVFYRFQYGKDEINQIETITKTLNSDVGSTIIEAEISELDPDSSYNFRLVLENSIGTIFSETKNFTPGKPIIYVPADRSSIQAAIDFATDGHTIILADGVYRGDGNINLDFQGKAITLRSENGADLTVINCENSGNAFNFLNGENRNAIIDGFAITNSRADGGAIACVGSSPTIRNCRIVDNFGNGIYLENSEAKIENCVVENNGGGILARWSSPEILDCAIVGNSSESSGGGIRLDASGGTIEKCRIIDNFAKIDGGGILLKIASTKISNTIFSANRSSRGGAISAFSYATSEIVNCTFYKNIASKNGGGIYFDRSSNLAVRNSILWGDEPNEIYGNDRLIEVSHSDILGGYDGTFNISADPIFADADRGDFRLSSESPTVGTASAEFAPETDINGNLRSDLPTMGAYETTIEILRQQTITTQVVGGGKIEPIGNTANREISVERKSDITFRIAPDDGYILKNIKIDGASIGAVFDYTFERVKTDHRIEAEFITVPYSLKITAPEFIYEADLLKFTVEIRDVNGELIDLENDTVIELSSTSLNGSFDLDQNGNFATPRVTVMAGSHAITGFYRDRTIGEITLTATDRSESRLGNSEHRFDLRSAISSLKVHGSPLLIGDEISVIAVGRPNSEASFSIGGIADNLPLIEEKSGEYIGKFSPSAEELPAEGSYDLRVKIGVGTEFVEDGIEIDLTPKIQNLTVDREVVRNGQTLIFEVTANRHDLKISADLLTIDSTKNEPNYFFDEKDNLVYQLTTEISESSSIEDGLKNIVVSVEDSESRTSENLSIEIELRNFVHFDLKVPQGIAMTHIPLKVAEVDGRSAHLEKISDLYDLLGGENHVHLLMSYNDRSGRWHSYLGSRSEGKSADRVISEEMGIITVMKRPRTLKLSGYALGSKGTSFVELSKGMNLFGIPLDDFRLKSVSDLIELDGVAEVATHIVMASFGRFSLVAGPSYEGELVVFEDVPIVGGQSIALFCREAQTIEIPGEAWQNPIEPQILAASGFAAPTAKIPESDTEIVERLTELMEPPKVAENHRILSTPKLYQNYPNPFNPETWIPFELPSRSEVILGIYDGNGMKIQEMEFSSMLPGRHVVPWDGRNDRGEKVSSGIYFYQLNVDKFRSTRKMVILK